MSNRRQPIRNPFARDFSEPSPTPRIAPRNDEKLVPTPSKMVVSQQNYSTATPHPPPQQQQANVRADKPTLMMNIDNRLFTHINPFLATSQQQPLPIMGAPQEQLPCQSNLQVNISHSVPSAPQSVSPEDDCTMYSSSDYLPYDLPIELAFGKLKSTTNYSRYEKLADSPNCRVYRGRDIKAKKTIAMKIVGQHDKNGTIKKDIFREITLLKTLEHTNIIQLIDVVGLEIDNLFLILEYCPCSVAKFIDRYPNDRVIAMSEIKSIIKGSLKGLHYLHSNFIIHRDIKTSNLVISKEGIVKIIDFGLSRRYTNTSYGTPMTPNVCTRWYQAPEILLESPTYDEKIDIWSIGCVLGELLFKKPLLPGVSDIHQINLMIDLLGSPSPNTWPGFTKCNIPKNIRLKKQLYNRLEERLNSIGREDSLDLLCQLLQYDPCKRISAFDALQDDFMQKAPFPAPNIDLSGIISNLD